MAGRFLQAKYERNNGDVHNIRIQPETVFAENLEPAAAVTKSAYVRVGGSKRAYGIKARILVLSRDIGDATDYNGGTVYARIPVLKKASVALLVVGSTITYQNVAWKIVGVQPESSR